MAPTIKLREGVNDRLKELFDCSTDGAVADRIGVNPSTWSRAIRGKAIPGTKLRNRLMGIDGMGFHDIFVLVIDDPDGESA